jgi:hypothetical protein
LRVDLVFLLLDEAQTYKYNLITLGGVNEVVLMECACSEDFKFPIHAGIFSITFHFKCVLNILF